MRRGVWRSLAALVFALLATAPVSAQESATLSRFSASALPADDFEVDRPIAPGHLNLGAMVHVDYALDPLVFQSAGEDGREVKIVRHHMTANAALALGLSDRAFLFAGVPATVWMEGQNDPTVGAAPLVQADEAGLGNAYAGGRVVLLGNPTTLASLALQAAVTFPTAGKNQRFRGESFVSVVPELLLAFRLVKGVRLTTNVGSRARRSVQDDASNLEFGTEFTYALGLAANVWRGPGDARLELHAQAFGATRFRDLDDTPVETLLGAKYFGSSGVMLGAGAGPGITRGFGSPVVRALVTLGYQTPTNSDRDRDGLIDTVDSCPDEPEDRDGFEDANGCPDPDNDQDGVLDGLDACPIEPESPNGLEDADGCPDAWGDQDQDTFLDNVDACPNEPEDVDDFEDKDGCPDPDNDQDGTLDTQDACPLEPGSRAEKGCPVRDRDGDSVPDSVDNCPDEPGSVDNHGCVAKQRVEIVAAGLRILEKVYFRTSSARIRRRSYDLLDNVANVLTAHPELKRVVVKGHTDSRGRRSFNLRLSRSRAQAVVEYLVRRGVSQTRLMARGVGPDEPLVSPARRSRDHAANRRVEFSIPSVDDSAPLREDPEATRP